MFPELLARVPEYAVYSDSLAGDHHQLDRMIDALREALADWAGHTADERRRSRCPLRGARPRRRAARLPRGAPRDRGRRRAADGPSQLHVRGVRRAREAGRQGDHDPPGDVHGAVVHGDGRRRDRRHAHCARRRSRSRSSTSSPAAATPGWSPRRSECGHDPHQPARPAVASPPLRDRGARRLARLRTGAGDDRRHQPALEGGHQHRGAVRRRRMGRRQRREGPVHHVAADRRRTGRRDRVAARRHRRQPDPRRAHTDRRHGRQRHRLRPRQHDPAAQAQRGAGRRCRPATGRSPTNASTSAWATRSISAARPCRSSPRSARRRSTSACRPCSCRCRSCSTCCSPTRTWRRRSWSPAIVSPADADDLDGSVTC